MIATAPFSFSPGSASAICSQCTLASAWNTAGGWGMGAVPITSQLFSAAPFSSHFSPAPAWGLPWAAVPQEMLRHSFSTGLEHLLPFLCTDLGGCRAGSLRLAPRSFLSQALFSPLSPHFPEAPPSGLWGLVVPCGEAAGAIWNWLCLHGAVLASLHAAALQPPASTEAPAPKCWSFGKILVSKLTFSIFR